MWSFAGVLTSLTLQLFFFSDTFIWLGSVGCCSWQVADKWVQGSIRSCVSCLYRGVWTHISRLVISRTCMWWSSVFVAPDALLAYPRCPCLLWCRWSRSGNVVLLYLSVALNAAYYSFQRFSETVAYWAFCRSNTYISSLATMLERHFYGDELWLPISVSGCVSVSVFVLGFCYHEKKNEAFYVLSKWSISS